MWFLDSQSRIRFTRILTRSPHSIPERDNSIVATRCSVVACGSSIPRVLSRFLNRILKTLCLSASIYHSATLSCPYPNWIKSFGGQISQGIAVAPQCHGNSGGASAAGRSAARGRVRSHVAQCRTQAGLVQDDIDQPSPGLPHLL